MYLLGCPQPPLLGIKPILEIRMSEQAATAEVHVYIGRSSISDLFDFSVLKKGKKAR